MTKRSTGTALIERMEDTSRLFWDPVVRFFIGGPLDGRAIEGADSREWEAGPCAGTSDHWYDGWVLYRWRGWDEKRQWDVYVVDPVELLRRARARYIAGDLDLDEFGQAVDWALAAEQMASSDPGSTFARTTLG